MKKEEKLPDNIKPEMIGEKRYVRMAEGAKRYSVGLNSFRNMAAEAHAMICRSLRDNSQRQNDGNNILEFVKNS